MRVYKVKLELSVEYITLAEFHRTMWTMKKTSRETEVEFRSRVLSFILGERIISWEVIDDEKTDIT